MRTSRTGYVMAMLAGLAIVGASTGGVVAATSHHQQSLAAESSAAAAVTTADDTTAPAMASSPSVAEPTPATATVASATPAPADPSTTPSVSGRVGSSGPTSTAPAARIVVPTVPKRTTTAAPAPSTAAAVKLQFKDGQYTATGSYNSPGGIEKLGVTLTLSADKVTKSVLDLQGGAGLSHSFQSAFESGYSAQVIGKDIASISLGAVSGSSLTGLGFNDALKQIESKAHL